MLKQINGQTEIYGLVGFPISHSLSPKIHNYLFNLFELNAVYLCFNSKFEIEDFKNFLNSLKKVENFKGLNVTIPYKEWGCNFSQNEFKSLGAINCIKFYKDKIIATNTDIYGFKMALKNDLNFNWNNKNILIFGAGATAKTIIYSIIDEVNKIYIYNRTLKNAEKLKNFFNKEKIIIGFPENFEIIDLVINSTPIGLHGEELNIDYKKLKKDCCLFDVIYLDTPFIKKGKELGLKAINGKSMLIYQAVKSFEYWTGLDVNETVIKSIFKEL